MSRNIEEQMTQEHIDYLKAMTMPMKSARIAKVAGFEKQKGLTLLRNLVKLDYVTGEGNTCEKIYMRTKSDIPSKPYTIYKEIDIDPIDLDYPHWPVPASTLERQADRYPSFRG